MKEYEQVVYQASESISRSCQSLDEKETAFRWIQASDLPIRYHQWVSLDLSPPSLFDSIATQEYLEWLEEAEDFKYRYNIIPMPKDGDSITEYFLKLSSDCLHHEKETQWWKSLQSFIHFLRNKKLPFDETGYLNTYFPKQMEVK